ncbi:MAG: bifunctional homocysteine S-methyltransferase/methylenetetrahydrofolate reductase, partial [Clostridiales bacterium]|nr:bifunctional homocysteine S-methyltransferase/methylenetetrahydrofolate reductase [Clostridiales bacterium]
EIPGINIPKVVIDRFSPEMTREEAGQTGADIAIETAKKVRAVSDGYYFITPFNRYGLIADILGKVH